MTSISATSGSGYLSPLQQLQAELQSEVNSGAISSSDQGALSSALTDINSSLQAGSAGNSGGTNSPPGDLKIKIDNLIAGEVSSGKLTSAQATELQGVFQAAFAGGPADSSGTAAAGAAAPSGPSPGGGPGGAHGLPSLSQRYAAMRIGSPAQARRVIAPCQRPFSSSLSGDVGQSAAIVSKMAIHELR